MIIFGTWVDDSAKMVTSADFWDRLVDAGYKTAALMLDTSYSDWDPRYSIAQLKTISKLAVVDRDVELVGTFWPAPHPQILQDMYEGLDRCLGEMGAAGVEPDIEGLMRARVAKEMGWNIRDAKLRLVEILWELKDKYDLRVEVTTHPSHPEAQEGAIVSSDDVVDRNVWQLYSSRHDWHGELVSWNGRYGPYGRQVDTKRLAELSTKWGKKYSFGQAAWDQKWPGHTVEEAMTIPHEGYMAYHPEEIRDWASGRPIGRFRNDAFNPQILEARKKLILAYSTECNFRNNTRGSI